MEIGLSAFAWTTRFDRTHLCPFFPGRRKGIEEFEAFFTRCCRGCQRILRYSWSPRVGVLINWFHANMEVRKIEDAVCPGSGHVDFPAIAAAPREIGFDGYFMMECSGDLAAGRNFRGAFFLGGVSATPDEIAFKGSADLDRSAHARSDAA